MADNFQSYKVTANEQSSATKFNNGIQAFEDAINSLDNSNVAAAAAIAVSKLAAGTEGYVITTSAGVPVWAATAASVGYSTSLPGSPTNGQEHILVDSTTAPTYSWRFRYNSAKATNKWDFIGGAPLLAVNNASSTRSSASYGDLADAATPSVTAPVAGLYIVRHGFTLTAAAFADVEVRGSFSVGATAAIDDDGARAFYAIVNPLSSVSKTTSKTIAASDLLKLQYKSNGQQITIEKRWIELTPIAIGG